MSVPPLIRSLYSSKLKNIPQDCFSMFLFNEDFALTLCPGLLRVPFADLDIFFTFKFSTAAMPLFLTIAVVSS